MSEAVLVGAIALAFMVPLWFSGTASARSHATAARYYGVLFAYTGALVIVYAAVVALILIWRRVASLDELMTPLKSVRREQLVALALPVGAFLLVAASVRLPLFAKARTWVRRGLNKAMRAPTEAEVLADELVRADPNLSTEERADVTLHHQMHGYDPAEIWLPVAEPMRTLWFKSTALFFKIRRWTEDRHYSGFAQAAAGDFDLLRGRFDQLSLKVARVMDIVERLGGLLPAQEENESSPVETKSPSPLEGADRIRRIVIEILANLREDIAFFHRSVCLFVARGVLAGSLTAGGRQHRLSALGYELESRPRSPLLILVFAWVGYFLIFVWGGMNTQRVVMISTTMVLSLATAIVPKRYWGFANEDLYGHTPWPFVAAAGLTSAALWAGNRQIFYLLSRDSSQPMRSLSQSFPWALPAFTTGAMTAFLIQDSRWSGLPSGWARRALDGLMMAAAMTAGTFGSLWLVRHHPPNLESLDLPLTSGFLAGWLVPGRFRRQVHTGHPRSPKRRSRVTSGVAVMPRA